MGHSILLHYFQFCLAICWLGCADSPREVDPLINVYERSKRQEHLRQVISRRQLAIQASPVNILLSSDYECALILKKCNIERQRQQQACKHRNDAHFLQPCNFEHLIEHPNDESDATESQTRQNLIDCEVLLRLGVNLSHYLKLLIYPFHILD